MSAQVISLFDYFETSRDWTQRELSEFYRVEGALIQAGIQLETDRGVTDEGEPWFVFCRSDTGEAFIHFARVDGKYIAVGSALDQVVEGRDFAALVQEILAGQAWVMAKARNRSNVFLHPSALLIAIVGAAFFHSGEAKAAETTTHVRTEVRRHVLPILIGNFGDKAAPALDAAETAAIVSSVLIEWNRLTPIAPSSRDVLSMVSAASAAELAAPSPLAHTSTVVGDLAVQTFAHDGDPATASQGVWPVAAPVGHPGRRSLTTSVEPGQHGFAGASFCRQHRAGQHQRGKPPRRPFGGHRDQRRSPGCDFEHGRGRDHPVSQHPGRPGAPVRAGHAVDRIDGSGRSWRTPCGRPGLGSFGADSCRRPQRAAPTIAGAPPTVPTTADGHDAQAASPPGLIAIDPHISAAVSQFVAEVSVLDVAVSGHEIILYDGAIFKSLPPGTVLESMTFNFSDGSSISLVGTVAELQHIHWT